MQRDKRGKKLKESSFSLLVALLGRLLSMTPHCGEVLVSCPDLSVESFSVLTVVHREKVWNISLGICRETATF